jgi:Uncharacterized protein involved in cytokinesis, contains TGc (transglutaminase/protease-like) domain
MEDSYVMMKKGVLILLKVVTVFIALNFFPLSIQAAQMISNQKSNITDSLGTSSSIGVYENVIDVLVNESLNVYSIEYIMERVNDYSITFADGSIEKYYDKIGSYPEKILITDDTTGFSDMVNIVVNVLDKTKPVISGVKDLTVYLNSKDSILIGVTAKDNVDGDLTNKIKFTKFDISKIGTYDVLYTVTDKSGNTQTQKAVITVAYDPKNACNSKKELALKLRAGMIEHKQEFSILVTKDFLDKNEIGSFETLYELLNLVDDKDVTVDGDYLFSIIRKYGANWYRDEYPNQQVMNLRISVEYDTTLKQEAKLETQIASVIKTLNIDKVSDYKKVKAIHDYIVNKLTYDTSQTSYTAYDALFKKKANCYGFSLLTYRMLEAAGVECKIITGRQNGESHAWNIVQVDGKWYNLDVTFDRGLSKSNSISYIYFLKSAEGFKKHIRNEMYLTKEFIKKYTISKANCDN